MTYSEQNETSLKKSYPAFLKFQDWLKKRGEKTYPEFKIPLLHYTSMNALENILKSEKVWLTNIFAQKSDPFEIRSGLEICYRLIDEAAQRSPFSGTKLFSYKYREILENHIEQVGQFFLFCTSKIADDPYQWTTFADGGRGGCLEFSTEFAGRFSDTPLDDDGKSCNGLFPVFNVYYDDNMLREDLNNIITEAMARLDEGLGLANPDREEGLSFLEYMTVYLASACIPHCAEYKLNNFLRENETRFLCIARADRSIRNLRTHTEKDQTKTYIEYNFCEKDLKTIWIGPLDSADTEDKFRKLLDEKGWRSVEIKKSQIPFK